MASLPLHPTRLLAALILTAILAVAQANVDAGLRAIDRGDFEAAIAAFEASIAANDQDAVAHYLLARAAVYAAAELDGDDRSGREALYDRAATHARRAVRLTPNDPDAHFEVARALGRLAQYRGVLQSLNLASQVAAALDRTLALQADHAPAWHARGLFHHDVPWIAGGRSGLVKSSFERAIAAEPDAITHRVAFGRVLIERGERDAGRTQLEVALSLPASTFHQRQDHDTARALLATLP
jgi:tetratricopeptide (TPR) repeat protein